MELRGWIRQPALYLFVLFITGMTIEFATETGSGLLGQTALLLTPGRAAVGSIEMISGLISLLLLVFCYGVLSPRRREWV